MINLNLDEYQQEGLYLILPDSSRLMLTKEVIEETFGKWRKDSAKIPLRVQEAAEFQRCQICPLRSKGGVCDAIRPIFPFLEIVDKYVSFDKVTAIFKGESKGIVHVSDSTMQEALKHVSILSLIHYCQNGRKYRKYFFGIIPLMSPKEVASRIYLNIYWLHKGRKEEIEKVVTRFSEEIRQTSRNQVKRLNMICKNDAFMNAFVATQVATEFLSMDMNSVLEQSFASIESSPQ
ncbi:MAG: hypothetical protein HQ558_01875 [Candidatus Omnitrophica bacterium]|nr:hypothetical protein [Candidatus Omnitrophota bacterium]